MSPIVSAATTWTPSFAGVFAPVQVLLIVHMLTRLPLPMHSYSGLVDVRTIPGRSVAFVEFTDSVTSAVAKDALNGHAFSDTEKLRITFAK